MAIESAEDRLAYLTEFGEMGDMHVGASNWDVWGIFDNAFIDVEGVESRQPIFECRFDDIYKPGELQNIEFRGTSLLLVAGGYNIVEVREDGTEMVVLELELQ